MRISALRNEYHRRICETIVRIQRSFDKEKGYPNFADGASKASVEIAWRMLDKLGYCENLEPVKSQTVGERFEKVTLDFLQRAFTLLLHLRPGSWVYSASRTAIYGFEQYEHLSDVERIISQNQELSSALGGDYVVKPDIVIGRRPVTEDDINQPDMVVSETDKTARLTPLRASNREIPKPILHASISCKWTIRSDRSQNTRTEALNLIRNRKGHLPHIVAVSAEPLATRLSTLALGTGDLDCVYHFALYELQEATSEIGNEDQLDMLRMMIEGRRLRDISDLPFDLAV